MFEYFTKIFRSTWQFFALFIIVLVVAVAYILAKHSMATTTDARVVTNVIPIASSVSGVVSHIDVQDNQFVKQGQSLFELSADEIQLQVVHAQARIAVLKQSISGLETELSNAQKELDKSTSNADSNQAKSDDPEHSIELIKAKIAQKRAALREAKIHFGSANKQMSQLVIRAPTSGYISNFNLHEGAVVKSYHTLFGIIQPAPVWVIANFLETELVRIRPGQTALVKINMYPNIEFEGEVESIGYGITPDNDSPLSNVLPTVVSNSSWVHLSQRFPVKIRLHNPDPNTPMRVGANAQVKVYTES